MEHFKAVIIGSGQGGNPLTTLLASKGWKTALIEKKFVGGTCINYGCTPTKTMVATAQVAYLTRRAQDYGVQTENVNVDMEAIRQRKRHIVSNFRNGNVSRIEDSGTELIRGSARFSGVKQISVALNDGGIRELSADYIFIDTGGSPQIPDIPGLDQVEYLNSTTIMELGELPRHLIIIGGGYVGLEFGQMFRRFGSRVTIIQRGEQLLTREDEDIAENVAEIFKEDGIKVLLNSTPEKIRKKDSGQIEVLVKDHQYNSEDIITGSHILVAAGRIPNTNNLNLESAGVETDEHGYIIVNDRLETSAENIYALGDVKGGPAFTHISYDDYRIIQNHLFDDGSRSVDDRPVPYVVYIDPQLGRIGLSEKQARKKNINYRLARIPMNYVARALELDQSRGMMKALVDPETDQILGATVLGIQGGELMAMLQIAMMGKVPYQKLRDGVFSHPSLAESLNTLFGSFVETESQ